MDTEVVKILLLDVDGVLNCHDRHPNGFCGMHPSKVALLDRIVAETDCRIVLASSWRYMVLGGAMSLKGFGHLLATYGAAEGTVNALIDTLPEDRAVNDLHDRGKLAAGWVELHKELIWHVHGPEPVVHAVALDDGSWPDGFDLGYEVMGIPSVRPKPTVGLTEREMVRVIALLNSPPKESP